MKLDGHKRLDVFVPEALWERMEQARGERTRSEWVRSAIEHRIHVESMARTLPPPGHRLHEFEDPANQFRAADAVKTAREILKERTELLRQGKNVQ